MRLLDELNEIKQTDFGLQRNKEKRIEKYKNKITKKLKVLRSKGIKEYNTKLPCNIWEDLKYYFEREGIWIVYLGSDDNITCRVLICPEVHLMV